jgi:hypothetical protein
MNKSRGGSTKSLGEPSIALRSKTKSGEEYKSSLRLETRAGYSFAASGRRTTADRGGDRKLGSSKKTVGRSMRMSLC